MCSESWRVFFGVPQNKFSSPQISAQRFPPAAEGKRDGNLP